MGTRKNKGLENQPLGKDGGASRDRTGDLLHAMQALSQLSYSPAFRPESAHRLAKFRTWTPGGSAPKER